MPLYNGAAHVAEAVTSLLAQTGIDLELIVVDDGSTDEGPEIIRRIAPRTTILRRPQPGVATARNMGVEAAEGEYLAFLDADDVLPDRSLAVRLSRLEGDPSLGAVFGRMEEFVTIGQGGSTAPVRSPVGPTDARLAPTMLIRRRAFHE